MELRNETPERQEWKSPEGHQCPTDRRIDAVWAAPRESSARLSVPFFGTCSRRRWKGQALPTKVGPADFTSRTAFNSCVMQTPGGIAKATLASSVRGLPFQSHRPGERPKKGAVLGNHGRAHCR